MQTTTTPKCLLWLAAVMTVWSQSSLAQLPAASLQLSPLPDGTNLGLRISTQPGFTYAIEQSADLAHWLWQGSLYSDGLTLNWMTSLAQSTPRFFRTQSGLPNTQVVTNYHNWTNTVWLNNGLVEVVVVPNAGRVMQFRFLGDTNGPFWENPALYGQNATPTSWNTEGGFGGDKAWPSPQSDWGWPPPSGFDGSTNSCTFSNGVVTLTTPVDATYQVRTTRVLELAIGQPVMRIRTIFERVSATTLTNKVLGNWVITQTQEPVRVYVPVPQASIFTQGYTQLGTGLPSQFSNTNRLISFTRDTVASHKLGFDTGALAWVGTNLALRIDSPRLAGLPQSSYPDGGCNTEVYTNPGAPYVELECLGPLAKLPVGARMEFVTTYTLFRRTETDPDTEAHRILGVP